MAFLYRLSQFSQKFRDYLFRQDTCLFPDSGTRLFCLAIDENPECRNRLSLYLFPASHESQRSGLMSAAPGGTAGNMDPGEHTVGKIFFPHPFDTMGQKPLRTAHSLLTDRDTDAAGAGFKEIFPSPSCGFQDPGHLLCREMKEIHGPVRGKTNLCIRNIFQHFAEYHNTFLSKAASYRMIRNPVKS